MLAGPRNAAELGCFPKLGYIQGLPAGLDVNNLQHGILQGVTEMGQPHRSPLQPSTISPLFERHGAEHSPDCTNTVRPFFF